ncbi:hypothetical protein CDD82_2438 [Ophiocordyceps australis]|uniref:Uncharacterized protein n=1 Tax=Ophiocordyceps australis TaxID=1399860 RepID=A0A2C5XWQ1_9HYPO|nr:hypothetical protein CDD82_2438 [Ophiocordyceps australis]
MAALSRARCCRLAAPCFGLYPWPPVARPRVLLALVPVARMLPPVKLPLAYMPSVDVLPVDMPAAPPALARVVMVVMVVVAVIAAAVWIVVVVFAVAVAPAVAALAVEVHPPSGDGGGARSNGRGSNGCCSGGPFSGGPFSGGAFGGACNGRGHTPSTPVVRLVWPPSPTCREPFVSPL